MCYRAALARHWFIAVAIAWNRGRDSSVSFGFASTWPGIACDSRTRPSQRRLREDPDAQGHALQRFVASEWVRAPLDRADPGDSSSEFSRVQAEHYLLAGPRTG